MAEEYATRIVKLRDGKITDDSDPYTVDSSKLVEPEHQNMGHASMSFLTALSLSFNNLRTKKARTLLTSFAGSIGIIGIALILSLSTGVNTYIEDIQKSTMTSYPITVDAQSMDLSSMLEAGRESSTADVTHEMDGIYSNATDIEMASSVSMSITENNLTEFKKYLDDEGSEIHQYLGENGIIYSYDVSFDVFTYDTDDVLVNTDGVVIESNTVTGSSSMMSSMMGSMGGLMSTDTGNFSEMLPGKDGALVSTAVTDGYEVVYGGWPESYDEVVLVLDSNNEISLTTLYELGMLPSSEYTELMEQLENSEEVNPETVKWDYSDVEGLTFYMIPACDQYEKNEDGTWTYIGDNAEKLSEMTDDMVQLKVVGVVRPAADSQSASVSGTVGYTKALTDYIIEHTEDSEIVKEQKEQTEINILNGLAFAPADDEAKAADAAIYLSALNVSEKAALCTDILQSVYSDDPEMASQMLALSEEELAATLDQYLAGDTDTAMLVSIYDSYISTGTYEDNMTAFGVVSIEAPSSISIYADSFENKDAISTCIDNYNETASEENQISYTDYVGLLMSSVTTIVNVISYVLIAFVAVSLVVSSIMIGIITYISVLERTKEIGILRAIGASKRNISQVFNAETFIIGLCSGLIGIGITLLSLIPANAIIHAVAGTTGVSAQLPVTSAVLLIVLSVILTLIGGLIPSKKAAKKDPVTALRTE